MDLVVLYPILNTFIHNIHVYKRFILNKMHTVVTYHAECPFVYLCVLSDVLNKYV